VSLRAARPGPAVVTFYRVGWCPSAISSCGVPGRADASADLGAELVAISPRPDYASPTSRKAAHVPVSTDHTNRSRVRTDSSSPEATYSGAATGFGKPYPKFNGDDSWELPMPGTFVLDRAASCVFARRPELHAAVSSQRPSSTLSRAARCERLETSAPVAVGRRRLACRAAARKPEGAARRCDRRSSSRCRQRRRLARPSVSNEGLRDPPVERIGVLARYGSRSAEGSRRSRARPRRQGRLAIVALHEGPILLAFYEAAGARTAVRRTTRSRPRIQSTRNAA